MKAERASRPRRLSSISIIDCGKLTPTGRRKSVLELIFGHEII